MNVLKHATVYALVKCSNLIRAVGPQRLRLIRSVSCQGHAMRWCVTLLQHPPINAQLCSKNSTTHTSQHTHVRSRWQKSDTRHGLVFATKLCVTPLIQVPPTSKCAMNDLIEQKSCAHIVVLLEHPKCAYIAEESVSTRVTQMCNL